MASAENFITLKNPAGHPTGSAPAPTAASNNAAAQADDGAALTLNIKKEASLPPPSVPASAPSEISDQDIPPAYSDMPLPMIDQHHEVYFRLKAIAPPDKSPLRFANSSRLCSALLAQLASIPALLNTGLFMTGKLTLTISKHHNLTTKLFIYTASFATASNPNGSAVSAAIITDLILLAQTKIEADRKTPSLKGFLFNLPVLVPGAGHQDTSTRCTFSYDRATLLGLTTVDFQVKVPASLSISPHEDFALLIVQLFTPRANLSEAEYLNLTRADRVRFANCCTPRKHVATPHGDWMDELMFGTFSLNFEDVDSRDSLIWNFLMFGAFFGLDPRFGHHQQFQLFIPSLHDQHQLDRRPAAMRDAVKSFKSNQPLLNLLPAKPRRSRPKTSDTSSDTESESLFLENITRRSEAILILKEVPLDDALATLHYPPLDSAQFTHVLKIPQAPVGEPQFTATVINPAPVAVTSVGEPYSTAIAIDPDSNPDAEARSEIKPPCMSWTTSSRCKEGNLCRFVHSTLVPVTTAISEMRSTKPSCTSWVTSATCRAGNLCHFSHSSAAQSDEFRGEGKRDIACIKWSEFRCTRGDRCLYRHDIRDELAKQLQRLKLPPDTAAQSITFARRLQAASPGKGAAQLANLLDAIDLTFANSLLAPLQLPQLNALASLVAGTSHTPAPLLAIQPVPPLFTDLKRLSLEQHPTLKHEGPPVVLIAPRFTRSLLAANAGDLNGFCTRGHKIFKRTPIRMSETHKCSFCKAEHRSDVFTCAHGCSHSCLLCLNLHNTAPAPPRCSAHLCPGFCTIEILTKPSTCWNGGHSLKRGAGVWHCNICKFLICRTCIASSPPSASAPSSLAQLSQHGLPETPSAISANASASVLQ
jgi:hypothetical protein